MCSISELIFTEGVRLAGQDKGKIFRTYVQQINIKRIDLAQWQIYSRQKLDLITENLPKTKVKQNSSEAP